MSSPQVMSSPRHKRRLPRVQRAPCARPLKFWPTYRGAVDWLRRNQDTLDTAMGLLEIYPSLIQEMCLDSLWRFVAPFATPGWRFAGPSRRPPSHRTRGADTSRPTSQTQSSTSRTLGPGPVPPDSTTTDTAHIPVISITYAPDDREPELQALSPGPADDDDNEGGRGEGVPRVYLCGLCSQDSKEKLFERVLHALHHEFYVKAGPWQDSTDRLGHTTCHDLRDAHVCVFVLDDLMLNAPACFDSLCAARAVSIPTVFVKDSAYSLPNSLPDLVLQHNLSLDFPETRREWNPGNPERGPAQGASHSVKNAPRASSGRSMRKPRPSSAQGLQETDMVLHLLNGYRTAMVFEESCRQACEEELRSSVRALLGSGGGQEKCSSIGTRSASARSPNTLHPFSRSGSRCHAGHHNTFLSMPRASPACKTHTANGNQSEDRSEEAAFVHCDSQSPLTAIRPASSCDSRLSPDSQSHSLPSSPCSSPVSPGGAGLSIYSKTPPFFLCASQRHVAPPSPVSPSPSSSSSSRCSTRLSLHHLHQLQQQILKDREYFLANASLPKDRAMPDNPEGGQTTYLVCSKSGQSLHREPRLVHWPQSADCQAEQQGHESEPLSEALSDSPHGFRDLDLTVLVNKPRRETDTPDSDGSNLF